MSSVGRVSEIDQLNPRARSQAGVTLLEMIVVVSLIAIMIGVAFPGVAAGIESLRLRSGAEDTVAALNSALVRANRQQDAVDVTISPRARAISTQTVRTNVYRKVELPDGVQIARVLPPLSLSGDATSQDDRHFFIYPDGSVPNIVIDLVNPKGFHRLVAVDPITGVAREQSLAATNLTGESK